MEQQNPDIVLEDGRDDMQEATAKIFSRYWWQTSGVAILLIVVVFQIFKLIPAEHTRIAGLVLGWWILIWAFLPSFAHWAFRQWHVRYGLPLQLCDISAFFTAFSLLTEDPRMFEIALYWGVTGAFHAFLTPQFTQGTQKFFQLEFYVSHAGLVLGPLFLRYIRGIEPAEWSWLMAGGWLLLLAMLVGAINHKTASNYMFLCRPPTAKNPFVRGEWPWYLVVFAVAMVLHFLAIYAIFR